MQYYCSQYGAMRKYCGESANFINADQPERWVHECILAVIMRDLPISSPRNPFDGPDQPVLDPDKDIHYKNF